jgi:hypothetical protein
MEQTRSLNALEPYIALSKSATAPRAAADLITQATSAPQTYVFAELLQTPNIQALRNSQEYGSHLRLLEIFCWGTLTDYKGSESHLQLQFEGSNIMQPHLDYRIYHKHSKTSFYNSHYSRYARNPLPSVMTYSNRISSQTAHQMISNSSRLSDKPSTHHS